MVFAKLQQLEKQVRENGGEPSCKLKVIKRFQRWLGQIDQKAEMVPVDKAGRLAELLASLKGEALTGEEQELVGEIVEGEVVEL